MFNELISLVGKVFDPVILFEIFHIQVDDVKIVDGRGYLTIKDLGVSLIYNADKRLEAVQFLSMHDGNADYSGGFLNGLHWRDRRDVVRQKLSGFLSSQESVDLPVLGRSLAWDKFLIGGLVFAVQYADPDIFVRLTVSYPDA